MTKLFKVAIIGSSKPNIDESREIGIRITRLLEKLKIQYGDYLVVISGSANGVDTIAEKCAVLLGIRTDMEPYKPKLQQWKYFKERNIKLAKDCHILYSFVLKSDDSFCHHCSKKGHVKSGACFTMNIAKNLEKETHQIII